jgi:hypothetical protein
MQYSFARIALTAALVLGLTACSKSPTENNDQPAEPDAQVAATAEVASQTSGYIETATTAYSSANAVPGLGKLTAPDDQLAACPEVKFDLLAKQFTLDYGTGCTGADGKTRSGSITVQYSGTISTGVTLTLTYNNYKANNKTFNGQMSVTAAISSIAIEIKNGTVTDENGTSTINANFTMTADLKGTPKDPSDDVYLVSGSGTVVESNKSYSFTMTEALRFEVGCSYPTSGKMTVTSNGGQPATVDFFPENGACDDVVLVTIGNLSTKINLGS